MNRAVALYYRRGILLGGRAVAHQNHGGVSSSSSSSMTMATTRTFAASSSSSSSSFNDNHTAQHQQQQQSQYVLDQDAVMDLFTQYAKPRNGVYTLNCDDIRALRAGIGEDPTDDQIIQQLFQVADLNGDGVIDWDEFLENAEYFLGSNPARIILICGGPGSGKGLLSRRLEKECHVVHVSSGDLLREEVMLGTKLGKQVQGIMARGELVSSAVMVALMKKRMNKFPGKRVLLDGFPRSVENAHDLVALSGKPELALHLNCDDTIMMERIMERGNSSVVRREDDNFQTALGRIRTFHKYHNLTLEWLREQHVPIVNLDGSGTPESVWEQLKAIGKLMRPAVKMPAAGEESIAPALFSS